MGLASSQAGQQEPALQRWQPPQGEQMGGRSRMDVMNIEGQGQSTIVIYLAVGECLPSP